MDSSRFQRDVYKSSNEFPLSSTRSMASTVIKILDTRYTRTMLSRDVLPAANDNEDD